jgi:hypothetical protein
MNTMIPPVVLRFGVRTTPLLAVLLIAFAGCTESATDADPQTNANRDDAPAPATFVDGRPVGLYLMTRFWTATNSLEKAVWYFAPDGTVYRGLMHGFSAAELAAHEGPRGTATVTGDNMKVTYTDGRSTDTRISTSGATFSWDGGIFKALSAYRNAADMVGVYDGGESIGSGGGSAVSSETLELRTDGTFSWSNVTSFRVGKKDDPTWNFSNSAATGRWALSGYTLTLTNAAGSTARLLAAPFTVETGERDWLLLGSVMYKPE